MRRKLLWILIILPLGVLLLALAIANREPVRLILDPFGGPETSLAIEAPLFLFFLTTFAMGLLIGGFATWLGQSKWRRMARTRGREAEDWKREAGRLEKELETLAESSPHGALPPD